jgi:predicted kinase
VSDSGTAVLIAFAGLPGAGKTAIAREVARRTSAVYLRIDSIEQALRDSGALRGPVDDAGYRAAYAVAEDNLRLGRTVVADCVNPIAITREAWRETARRAGARVLEVEVRCLDAREHRRRVEERAGDIPGLRLPTWDDVAAREYHSWDRERLVLDTAAQGVEECVRLVREALSW